MHNRLIIIGAGGHGRVIADSAVKNGYTDINFLDDRLTGQCLGFPILGITEDVEKFHDGRTDFIIGVGDNAIREELAKKYDVNWVALIHPSAQIGLKASVGAGTVIMANAVVNACAVVGKHCIVNTGVIVEHDNVLEDFAHISPNAALGGTVCIGTRSHVGIGVSVRNNTKICPDCIIGAGAVVVGHLTEAGTYMGLPARLIK